MTKVDVSSAAASQFDFNVLDVDFELRLFQDGLQVFGVRNGQTPRSHPISRGHRYVVRYNNNNGGSGVLHFQVRETQTESLVRLEVNDSTIASATVVEVEFSLVTNPAVLAPF